LHETGFHFNREYAVAGLNAARGCRQDDVQKSHDRAPMDDIKRVEYFRAHRKPEFGLAIIKFFKCDAQVVHKRNRNAKRNAHVRPWSSAADDGTDATVHRQPLASDVLARVGREQ